jgi:hypothetical protein
MSSKKKKKSLGNACEALLSCHARQHGAPLIALEDGSWKHRRQGILEFSIRHV